MSAANHIYLVVVDGSPVTAFTNRRGLTSTVNAAKSIPSLNNGRNIHADMRACGLSG
jgi:hypothetical protein